MNGSCSLINSINSLYHDLGQLVKSGVGLTAQTSLSCFNAGRLPIACTGLRVGKPTPQSPNTTSKNKRIRASLVPAWEKQRVPCAGGTQVVHSPQTLPEAACSPPKKATGLEFGPKGKGEVRFTANGRFMRVRANMTDVRNPNGSAYEGPLLLRTSYRETFLCGPGECRGDDEPACQGLCTARDLPFSVGVSCRRGNCKSVTSRNRADLYAGDGVLNVEIGAPSLSGEGAGQLSGTCIETSAGARAFCTGLLVK
jgi:hypothetical protein